MWDLIGGLAETDRDEVCGVPGTLGLRPSYAKNEVG